jgi:mRNA interferase RelE/StbE
VRMGSYRIEFARSAERDLRRIDRPVVPRIVSAIAGLEANPRPPGTKKLVGADRTYRLRVGDYRVIYTVDDSVFIVSVDRIRHRREVYR